MADKITISICQAGYTTHLDGSLWKSEHVKNDGGAGGLLTVLKRSLQGIAAQTDRGTLVIEVSNSHMEKWILDDVAAPPKKYEEQIFDIQKIMDNIPVRVIFRHRKITSAEQRLKTIFPTKGKQGESLADAFGDLE